MCVAAIIHKPVTLEYMQCMDIDNPHGAGVAWARDGKLFFAKGLKAEQIHAMQEGGTLTYPYLMHYRWATHGDRIPELTHPFPIGPRALVGELSGEAPSVMIHNGVWREYADFLPLVENAVGKEVCDAASDTSIAAYLMQDFPEIADLIQWAVAVAHIEDGKISIKLHGDVWQEYEGNQYSNLTWLPGSKWWNVNHSYSRKPGAGFAIRRKPLAWDWEAVEDDAKIWTPDPGKDPDFWDDTPKTFCDWQEYVRARYGDEVADAIKEEGGITIDAMIGAEDVLDEAYQDPDFVSDDPERVNSWLAARMIG